MTEEERNRLYPMPGGVAMSAQETALLEKSMGAALIKVAEFVKYILHMPGNVAPNTQEVWQQELENRKEYNVKFFSTDMSSPFFKSYSRSAPQVANTDIPTAPNSEVKTKKFTC